jgi:hypothetical protein
MFNTVKQGKTPMDNKNNSQFEKNGSDGSTDKGMEIEKKKGGLIARFLSWIARGAEQAAKEGNFCTR